MGASVADEELLLALLNSTPVRDGVPTDELARDDDAAAWARRHGGCGSGAELADLRRTRATLQAVVVGAADPGALAPALARIRSRPALEDDVLTWRLEAPEARRLGARAVLAWAQLQSALPGRLRPCANDECRLFLFDRSKAGTARWCSMASCGNRMKARRHHRRQRSGT